MNPRNYLSLTKILNKTLYRISLCLKGATIIVASAERKYCKYNITLVFKHENSATLVSAEGSDPDYRNAEKYFIESLVAEINREISSCERIEESAKKDWDMCQYIDESSGNLMMKTSFEMLLSSLKKVSKETKWEAEQASVLNDQG